MNLVISFSELYLLLLTQSWCECHVTHTPKCKWASQNKGKLWLNNTHCLCFPCAANELRQNLDLGLALLTKWPVFLQNSSGNPCPISGMHIKFFYKIRMIDYFVRDVRLLCSLLNALTAAGDVICLQLILELQSQLRFFARIVSHVFLRRWQRWGS